MDKEKKIIETLYNYKSTPRNTVYNTSTQHIILTTVKAIYIIYIIYARCMHINIYSIYTIHMTETN